MPAEVSLCCFDWGSDAMLLIFFYTSELPRHNLPGAEIDALIGQWRLFFEMTRVATFFLTNH
jgi:hypothetical protein